jgi:hypothetical protein
MSDRFFLDANIFVYSFDARSPQKAGIARELIRRAIKTGKGVVSYQVVQEFFNVALRRFGRPMSLGGAEQYLLNGQAALLLMVDSRGAHPWRCGGPGTPGALPEKWPNALFVLVLEAISSTRGRERFVLGFRPSLSEACCALL